MALKPLQGLGISTCCPDNTFLDGDGCVLLSRQSDLSGNCVKVPFHTVKHILWASGGPQHIPLHSPELMTRREDT